MLCIDNTSVIGSIRKGGSRSYATNTNVASALAALADRNVAVGVRYVRSAANPADVPSRIPVTQLTAANRDFMTQAAVAFLSSG